MKIKCKWLNAFLFHKDCGWGSGDNSYLQVHNSDLKQNIQFKLHAIVLAAIVGNLKCISVLSEALVGILHLLIL